MLEEYPWCNHTGDLTGAQKVGLVAKGFHPAFTNGKRNKRQRSHQFLLADEPEEITAIFAKKQLPPFLSGGKEFFYP